MRRIYVHPLPVRIWHWINAAGFLAMILTGLLMRYAGDGLIPFATAVRWHNWIGFVLIADYALWLGFYGTSPRVRCYFAHLNPRRFLAGSLRQVRYYAYGMFVGEPNPHRISIYDKFNPMQAALYLAVMTVLVPLQFYTGVLLWDLQRSQAQVAFWGGVRVVDSLHVLLFVFFVAYVFLHPYLSTLGESRMAQYRAMLTGYEEVEETAETARESKV